MKMFCYLFHTWFDVEDCPAYIFDADDGTIMGVCPVCAEHGLENFVTIDSRLLYPRKTAAAITAAVSV